MKTILGFHKRQWLLISAAVMSVVIINIIGICVRLPFSKAYFEKLAETAPELLEYLKCDPAYLLVFLKFLLVTVFLVAIAWLVVFLSKQAFVQKLPSTLKYGSEVLIAILVGGIFAGISIALANNWIDNLSRGSLYGLRYSLFVYKWSIRLVFPITSALIFWAMYLSNQHHDQPNNTEVSQ